MFGTFGMLPFYYRLCHDSSSSSSSSNVCSILGNLAESQKSLMTPRFKQSHRKTSIRNPLPKPSCVQIIAKIYQWSILVSQFQINPQVDWRHIYVYIYILYMYLILSRYTYVFDVWQLVYFLDMLSCFVQFNLQSLCNLTMAFSANFQLAFCSIVFIWMFPKIVAHPKSSILLGFSIINHPFWGTPIFGNIHLF